MFTMNFLNVRTNGLKALCLAAALAAATSLYGCSKGEQTAQTQAPAAAPAQQINADLGKEHFDKGVQFMLKKQNDDAVKEFEESLKFNPKSAPAYNNLGFSYMDKGDLDKAIDSQKKALENDPELANAYYGLAQALEKKGDKQGAVNNWKEFMKRAEPHSKWWMQAQAHIKNLEKKKK